MNVAVGVGAGLAGGIVLGVAGAVGALWGRGEFDGAANRPDRVVGINRVCDIVGSGRTIPARDVECTYIGKDGAALNQRYELTIQRAAGPTYQTSVPVSVVAQLGDPWPPKIAP
jgi:hypothetical protein